jgi:DNA-binding SARP family transcriptional activator
MLCIIGKHRSQIVRCVLFIEYSYSMSALIPRSGLSLCLLGNFQVWWEGQALGGLAYDKVRILLAYLVCERARGPQLRSHLASVLWPSVSPETARSNLRRTLHDLRHALSVGAMADSTEHWFVTDKQRIGLHPELVCWVDAEHFSRAVSLAGSPGECIERIEGQLAEVRGEFLHGLDLPDSPVFDAWLDKQRVAVTQHTAFLLHTLADCYEQLKQLEPFVAVVERELALNPCNEDAYRRLMRALACNGRVAAALAQFETCQHNLRVELGSEPDVQTLALARAIRRGELAQPCSATPAPVVKTPAERRQVCILACELRYQTSTVSTDQPLLDESRLDLLARCHSSFLDIVNTHGGHGVALTAHLFLAFFGYPHAQEQAPLHAAETAQDMLQHAALIQGLNVRIGVRCDWILSDPRFQLPDAGGKLTRQVIHLASHASWGQALVGPKLAALIEGYFTLTEQILLAGERHFSLQERSAATHSLEARAHLLTPFIGRSAELRRLRTLWQKTREGTIQTLLIRADAGMGKSRLLHMHRTLVLQDGGCCWWLRCQPEYRNTPYAPFIELLRLLLEGGASQAADLSNALATSAAPLTQLQLLDTWLTLRVPALLPHRAAYVDLLQLTLDAGQIALPRQKRKQCLDDALFALVTFLSEQTPTLFVVEDLHWADASSLEWLKNKLPCATAPGMLLLSARPGFEHPGIDVLELPALTRCQSNRLIQQICGTLEHDVLERTVQRADGVPLYLEEMAYALRESPAAEMPITLFNILATRLDTMGEAKLLAQQAAVIGRYFDPELLRSLWREDGHAAYPMDPFLAQLCDSGILMRTQGTPALLGFRHALLRDAAYETLATIDRKRLHARLARLYEGPFKAAIHHHPALLAQHLAAADEPVAAAQAWLLAGQQAVEHSAYQEAVVHFESAIAQLNGLSDDTSEQARVLELQLQSALGNVWLALYGYGSEKAKTSFARALELSSAVEDDPASFPIMWGLWLGGRSCTPQAYPLELVHRLERIAQKSRQNGHWMQVHYAYGNNLFWMARYDEADEHLQKALDLGQTQPSAELIRIYGEDTRISSTAFWAWVHFFQGRPQTAVRLMNQNVADARQTKHPNTLGFALTFSALLQRFLLDPEQAVAQAQELAELSQQHDLALWMAVATGVTGWARATQGDPLGLQQTEAATAMARAAMSAAEPTFWGLHVGALHALGHHQECAIQAEEALRACDKHLDQYFAAEFLRMRAEALNALPGMHLQALESLHRSMELAATQGAHTLELRAAMGLLALTVPAQQRQVLEQRIESIRAGCPELS